MSVRHVVSCLSLGIGSLMWVTGLLQPVHARHTYDFVDVQWDMRHADLLTNTPEEFRVDLRRFDDIVPADGKGAA